MFLLYAPVCPLLPTSPPLTGPPPASMQRRWRGWRRSLCCCCAASRSRPARTRTRIWCVLGWAGVWEVGPGSVGQSARPREEARQGEGCAHRNTLPQEEKEGGPRRPTRPLAAAALPAPMAGQPCAGPGGGQSAVSPDVVLPAAVLHRLPDDRCGLLVPAGWRRRRRLVGGPAGRGPGCRARHRAAAQPAAHAGGAVRWVGRMGAVLWLGTPQG